MTQAYTVAKVADVPEGEHIVVEVRGREIGLFNVRGRYYALPNVCFHQNGPLCRGATSGTVVANAQSIPAFLAQLDQKAQDEFRPADEISDTASPQITSTPNFPSVFSV